MIHSQNVDILGKNYNLFISAKGLPLNFVLTFFTVSKIKLFMKTPPCVMSVSITQ